MAIPDYFLRNAVAVSQAISGLNEERLESVLGDVCVGVTIGSDAGCREGLAIVDLLIRLLPRLYPSVSIREEGDSGLGEEAKLLARRINPRVDLSGQPTVEVVVGISRERPQATRTIFAGSSGWVAKLSTCEAQGCGDSNNPFGAGLAACMAAADLFRFLFLPGMELDGNAEFVIPDGIRLHNDATDIKGNVGSLVLAGGGAIGNAAVWALARTELTGTIGIVDYESIDLGNLQRYVLAERNDEGKGKSSALAGHFGGKLKAEGYETSLAEFLQSKRHRIDNLLLALDSAKDRCAAQASLPRRIANAWTQPSDLGVSVHDFLKGACVNCLYLPDGKQKNEDEIIAEAFGVPDRLMQVRELLHSNRGAPQDLLEAIASAGDLGLGKLLQFEGRPLRALYTEGFCGGAVVPLARIGEPANDVHVPLAHQSALAGVLLAAAGVRMGLSGGVSSLVTQFDVLKPQQSFQVYPVAKKPGRKCICEDKDYRDVYRKKFRRQKMA